MFETNKHLHKEYLDILQLSQEFRDIWQSKHLGFSGLFLAGVLEDYVNSPVKIMVVGRETKGWGKQFDNSYTLTEYIDVQMQKAQDYLKNRKDKLRGERGSSFHNFIRELTKQRDQSSVVWANLHCYSWEHNRTDKSPLSNQVDILSHQLLNAQIEILQPHYLIFAHGVAKHSVELRRRIFPIAKCETVEDQIFKEVSDNQLWNFEYQWSPNYRIKCFRIQHPSSFSQSSKLARNSLISYFNQLQESVTP